MIDISVVIPVYGCKNALPDLYSRLVRELNQLTKKFEIILVNDNCPQNSWEVIEELCTSDQRVVGINLSRNFGQIKAITAGLDYCSGEWVVVMDCDLQDRPEEIKRLFAKAKEGYDVVFARRAVRQDGLIKKLLSKSFYKVYNYFTDGNYDHSLCNFSITNKKVIMSYAQMREQNRAFVLFIKWMGFRQTSIDIQHDVRAEGKSSYNLKKRFRMATEIITSQSNKPLLLSVRIGSLMAFFAFIYAIYLVIRYLALGISIQGWTSIIVSLYLVGGILLINMGILGIYIGNIFNETKSRPIYLIQTIRNIKLQDGELVSSQRGSNVE